MVAMFVSGLERNEQC